MAHRHLMAVCVVCLLCAEHLPCKHVLAASTTNIIKSKDEKWSLETSTENDALVLLADEVAVENIYDKRKGKNKDEEKMRVKRHADHSNSHKHHHIELPEVTKNYLQKIFLQFNEQQQQQQSMQMNMNGFENMIGQLKLNHIFNSSINDKMCMNEETFLDKITHHNHHELEHEHEEEDHEHEHHDHHIEISTDNMLSMCPILLYYAINRDISSCLHISNFSMLDLNDETSSLIVMEDRKLVWLYSTLSIILVSLCGLFGVAVIPIMEKHFYHHILQFLVALAVGTLAGDALLHLLPHAMLPLTNDQDLHQTMMYRGLAAVLGIVFFYFFERFMVMIMEWRQKKEKREKPSSRVRVMRDPETVSLNGANMTCKHKYSSYPYCYDEIAMETKDDHHEHQHIEEEAVVNNHKDLIITSASDIKKMNGLIHDNSNDVDNTTLTLSTSLDDGSIESNALCNNNSNKQTGNPISNTTTNCKTTGENLQEENYTIILREHQSKHHGHSHTHGHVHSPPESLSAVAWMVIMGDGLHNFTDGMAIGAAFSNNIAGGFSTAVAVFCHELPHELGDFAVLLKAGMSPRKAVYYNLLSSVLCFFGMCVGIMIGDTPEASQWIFAVAAGLFIYIALVDMMPELTSTHGKEESCMLTQCFLQFSGMCTGFLCMLLIALYEHDLKEIFSS